MLHKNAVNFAVVSHIYCKTYIFDVFAAVLWGRAGKAALWRRVFIENTAVLGGRSSARRVDLWPRRGRVFCRMNCASAVWRDFAWCFAAIKSVLCYISVVCL